MFTRSRARADTLGATNVVMIASIQILPRNTFSGGRRFAPRGDRASTPLSHYDSGVGRRVRNVEPIASSMGVIAFQSFLGLQWPEASAGTDADSDSPASPMP